MEQIKFSETLDVLDSAGQPCKLAELWDERPVVLALIRHFG